MNLRSSELNIEKPPEWIWYFESASGERIVTFGRWAKHPQQSRYKLADIQATEHDHPTNSLAHHCEQLLAIIDNYDIDREAVDEDKDVVEAARACIDGYLALHDHHAKAIMAERERCAAIADRRAAALSKIKGYHSEVVELSTLAAAIRNTPKPSLDATS